jgi:hypothetical protein
MGCAGFSHRRLNITPTPIGERESRRRKAPGQGSSTYDAVNFSDFIPQQPCAAPEQVSCDKIEMSQAFVNKNPCFKFGGLNPEYEVQPSGRPEIGSAFSSAV